MDMGTDADGQASSVGLAPDCWDSQVLAPALSVTVISVAGSCSCSLPRHRWRASKRRLFLCALSQGLSDGVL